MLANKAPVYDITRGWLYYNSAEWNIDPDCLTTLDQIADQNIIWLDGEKTELADNEIILASDAIYAFEDNGRPIDISDSVENYAAALKNATLNKDYELFKDMDYLSEAGYKVAGVIQIDENNADLSGVAVVSEKDFNIFTSGKDAVYDFAVGKMPEDKQGVSDLVSYCYGDADSKTERFELQNSVTFELDTVNSVLHTLANVFLYIGLGFALFAALMLANFISTSISYKKQEIGILRAIGSRGNDVFRIFFAESFIIAMINFVLSSIGVYAATAIINYLIRNELGILITVLNFGVRQLLLLLAVSLAVAAAASYVPVKRIASKRPIDAIRNR